MAEKIVLEVCAFNIQSCIVAEQVGAARVELCDNPVEGGTTPSAGTIRRTAKGSASNCIPSCGRAPAISGTMKMSLRSSKEISCFCKELGCDGVSTACICKVERSISNASSVSWNGPIPWASPVTACSTARPILSSRSKRSSIAVAKGYSPADKPGAPEGAAMLAKLVQQANGRIIIMPGAGSTLY